MWEIELLIREAQLPEPDPGNNPDGPRQMSEAEMPTEKRRIQERETTQGGSKEEHITAGLATKKPNSRLPPHLVESCWLSALQTPDQVSR
ncbi:unnamed protein product, partial [Gadus morhua 'NCC']